MRSNIIIFMLLFLVSCGGTLSYDQLAQAKQICSDAGGIDFISVDMTKYEVFCENGLSKIYTKERQ